MIDLFRAEGPADEYADGAAPTDQGTTLRCYDPGSGRWHVIWMQPAGGELVSLTGWARGGDIVQESLPAAGEPRRRWSFLEITADSFVWLGEVSTHDSATWFLEQRMRATRA